MDHDTLYQLITSSLPELQEIGLSGLILIEPAAIETGEVLHFLVQVASQPDYAQFTRLTETLVTLLQRPVELVIVDARDAAVEPFLDPQAVRIL
jgi:hypothetical protein